LEARARCALAEKDVFANLFQHHLPRLAGQLRFRAAVAPAVADALVGLGHVSAAAKGAAETLREQAVLVQLALDVALYAAHVTLVPPEAAHADQVDGGKMATARAHPCGSRQTHDRQRGEGNHRASHGNTWRPRRGTRVDAQYAMVA